MNTKTNIVATTNTEIRKTLFPIVKISVTRNLRQLHQSTDQSIKLSITLSSERIPILKLEKQKEY